MVLFKSNNASLWHHIQQGDKHFYSPHGAFLDILQNESNLAKICSRIYTPFAGIIFDSAQQKVYVIRDHFGVAPCYYCILNETFIFGSCIPDLLKYITPPPLNAEQMNQLLINKWLNKEKYSDETYYQSIYRAEPGHELLIDLRTKELVKKCFWDLRYCNQTIHYSDKRDYVAHFSELLSEAISTLVPNTTHIAAEFSGGLDSSAVVTAAVQKNIDLTLYTHIAAENGLLQDDLPRVKNLIHTLGLKNIHYIDAQQFDLKQSMEEYAHYFAGGAPYVGFVLASNIHHTIAQQGHPTVLSGIGGDECVSGHAPLNFYLPQLMREQGKRATWHELYQKNALRKQGVGQKIKNSLKWVQLSLSHSNASLSEYEYNLLQGPGSHHLRMRIEYHSVVAKALGFNYAHPLLYPPLVEFCYQLPLEQKRRNGVNRCLIRDYLAQFVPAEVFGNQSKSGSVTPATMEKVRSLYETGTYQSLFNNLPFAKEREYLRIQGKINKNYPFIHEIPAYMFQTFWQGIAYPPHHRELV